MVARHFVNWEQHLSIWHSAFSPRSSLLFLKPDLSTATLEVHQQNWENSLMLHDCYWH